MESYIKKLPVSESFPTINLGQDEELGHKASSLKRRAVKMCPSVTSRLGCKCKERGCHCFHEGCWKPYN